MSNTKNYIFGIQAIREAQAAGKEIDKVFVKKGLQGEGVRELLKALRESNVTIQYVPIEKLNRITRKNHQGIVAYVSPIEYQFLEEIVTRTFEEGRVPLLIILDGVTDTRNLGAIARSAECAGADALIIPARSSAPITPDAMKTSAGALNTIPVCRINNLGDTIEYLQHSGMRVVAASEKAKQFHSETDMTTPLAIVLGDEGSGVSEDVIRKSDDLIGIPLMGTVGSLNVSVAAGILLFEAVRQRRSQPSL